MKKHFQTYKTIDTASDKQLPVFVPIGGGIIAKEDRIKNLPFRPWDKQRIKENAVFVPPGITYEKAIKNIEKKNTANKKLYKSSGRGQWSKKALKNIKESQAAMGIGKPPIKKCTNIACINFAPNAGRENNCDYYNDINMCTGANSSLKKKGNIFPASRPVMKIGKEFAELGNVPVLKGSDVIKARAKHQSKTEARTLNDISKEYSEEYAKAVERSYKFTKGFLKPAEEPSCDLIFGKNALKRWGIKLKKKRIPTRFNAKKLKEKHIALWNAIESTVELDINMQTNLMTSSEHRKNKNIAHNAAFTAIVEMIKRGLL